MMINADTKITTLLKHRADALDALVSISRRFEKLKNPLLYRLMAGRTSIATAARTAGCTVGDIFAKLRPLGFTVQDNAPDIIEETNAVPAFVKEIVEEDIIKLDVRPMIASGKDPLGPIMKQVEQLTRGKALKIINSFEPAPLMSLLSKQGFQSFSHTVSDNVVETYFIKRQSQQPKPQPGPAIQSGWDDIAARFKNRMQTIDVRDLEMPLPMLTILDALDTLPQDAALFVHHKRIPVFLLPELATRQFSYLIREIDEANVNLLIFRE